MGANATQGLRSIVLGEGAPKICVPLVDSTIDGLLVSASALPFDVLDIVELRIDYLNDVDDVASVRLALAAVREALPRDIPLLFTFRTLGEGGQRELDHVGYEALLAVAIDSGAVDAVDVEMFTKADTLARIVAHAHERNVVVIMSSHDFEATPSRDEIVARLRRQQDLGADVVKIAVMPSDARDVVTLIDATEDFTSNYATRPAITMSMGPLGTVTRVGGGVFGSCLTFGAVGAVSAPGQVEAGELRGALDVLHRAEAVGVGR